MLVQLPSVVGRVVTGMRQRDLDGLVPGWFGQVALQKQCLSTLEVGHLGHGGGFGFSIKYLPQGRNGGDPSVGAASRPAWCRWNPLEPCPALGGAGCHQNISLLCLRRGWLESGK